jgi:outer membrane protein OmpA-like peptidoglycan-associated protein
MLTVRKFLLLIILLSADVCLGQAQSASQWADYGGFVPGDMVIFSDDFSGDVPGTFPVHWTQKQAGRMAIVQQTAGSNSLEHLTGKGEFAEPRIIGDTPRGQYLTFECDFILRDTVKASLEISFAAEDDYNERYIRVDHNKVYSQWQGYDQRLSHVDGQMVSPIAAGYKPGRFNAFQWHHLAATFTKDVLAIFIDSRRIWAVGHKDTGRAYDGHYFTGYRPKMFTIGGSAPAGIRNIRFAESDNEPGEPTADNSLNTILEGKTLITHAILFDLNQATIKKESAEFLQGLAEWLQEHTDVHLQIDGHTDNIGRQEANRKLSLARANEVKRQLVLMGLAPGRLSTAGYGAGKPLKPNTTAENRAENRRVEFSRK